jgi:hypothetical protein
MESHEAVKAALAADASILHSVWLYLPSNVTVFIERLPQGFGQCKVTYQDNSTAITLWAEVIASTQRQLQTVDRSNTVQRVLGDEQAAGREQRRQQEAEAERNQLRIDREARVAELEAKAKALGDREKQLDDGSSRHARRQHHKDLKKILEDRSQNFSLTRTTEHKRYLIHALFVVLMVVPAAVLASSLWSGIYKPTTWNGTPADWAALLRLPLSIPPELIDRLSRNRFTTDRRSEAVISHPAQDLASALRPASSSITVPIPGGGHATLNAKGLRQFQKEAKTTDSG